MNDRIREMVAVLTAIDPASEEEDPSGQCLAALEGEASRDIEQLTRQIRRCCANKKWTGYQKRVACEQLVKLAFEATNRMHGLAEEFPELFREIAEELSHLPCLFPAHAEDLPSLQQLVWHKFNLGSRHTLKLRAATGRKTFSKKTSVNGLLLDLIMTIYEIARDEDESDPDMKYISNYRELAYTVPLTPKNAKQWLDVMWKLLLATTPKPEMVPRLRQLGDFPSRRQKGRNTSGSVGEKTQVSNIRATIKARLGFYLKRMLNEQAVHK